MLYRIKTSFEKETMNLINIGRLFSFEKFSYRLENNVIFSNDDIFFLSCSKFMKLVHVMANYNICR